MSTSTNLSPQRTWEPKSHEEYFRGITRALTYLQFVDGAKDEWLEHEVEARKDLKQRIRIAMTDPRLDLASIFADAVQALKDIYNIVKGSSNDADWEQRTPEKAKEIKGQLKDLANLVGELEQAVKP